MKRLFNTARRRWYWIRVQLRRYYWQLCFERYQSGAQIFGRITVYHPERVRFGRNATLNEGVILNAREYITIGDNVHISPGVIINTGTLDYTMVQHERRHIALPVVLEDGVWIGSGAIINPGVTVGRNSVIGAGAVVTSSIPANVVAVGVPAKPIKEI